MKIVITKFLTTFILLYQTSIADAQTRRKCADSQQQLVIYEGEGDYIQIKVRTCWDVRRNASLCNNNVLKSYCPVACGTCDGGEGVTSGKNCVLDLDLRFPWSRPDVNNFYGSDTMLVKKLDAAGNVDEADVCSSYNDKTSWDCTHEGEAFVEYDRALVGNYKALGRDEENVRISNAAGSVFRVQVRHNFTDKEVGQDPASARMDIRSRLIVKVNGRKKKRFQNRKNIGIPTHVVEDVFPFENGPSEPIDVVDEWLASQNLNEFGDPMDTVYAGGNPLFDETTGVMKDRYEYLVEKFPSKPWNSSKTFENGPSDPIDKVDEWLASQSLNEYGDPEDTAYTGGNPLFDQSTGEMKDRYEYLVEKFPSKPWDSSKTYGPSGPSDPIDKVDEWLASQSLNEFGDPEDTMYMGGNPLFDETTGEMKDRYEYLVEKFPSKPWDGAEMAPGMEISQADQRIPVPGEDDYFDDNYGAEKYDPDLSGYINHKYKGTYFLNINCDDDCNCRLKKKRPRCEVTAKLLPGGSNFERSERLAVRKVGSKVPGCSADNRNSWYCGHYGEAKASEVFITDYIIVSRQAEAVKIADAAKSTYSFTATRDNPPPFDSMPFSLYIYTPKQTFGPLTGAESGASFYVSSWGLNCDKFCNCDAFEMPSF